MAVGAKVWDEDGATVGYEDGWGGVGDGGGYRKVVVAARTGKEVKGVAVVEWEEEEENAEEEEGKEQEVVAAGEVQVEKEVGEEEGVVEGGVDEELDREARVAVEGGVEEEELDGEVRVTVEGGVEEGMEMEEAEAGRCSDQLQHRKNALRIRDQGLEVEADKEAEEALGLVELARREVAGVETGMGVTVETVVE
eukprot:gene13138-15511_t